MPTVAAVTKYLQQQGFPVQTYAAPTPLAAAGGSEVDTAEPLD